MNLVSHVHETAMTQPEKIAYHFMGKDTSYAELRSIGFMFASALQDLGIEKGTMLHFYLATHRISSFRFTLRCELVRQQFQSIRFTHQMKFRILYIIVMRKRVIARTSIFCLPLIEQAADAFPTIEHYVDL